ncbi:hypothetical protein M9H77_31107 [Catharanthus roseus]|uniref:Uncharacterized protein n=1 Tax=Catharanthus roseus TaxID=4058 RepID=A0ACB9ZZ37_CATRO|nr:hypothetical protein M9H77_31107 [Catharanthus roseus]
MLYSAIIVDVDDPIEQSSSRTIHSLDECRQVQFSVFVSSTTENDGEIMVERVIRRKFTKFEVSASKRRQRQPPTADGRVDLPSAVGFCPTCEMPFVGCYSLFGLLLTDLQTLLMLRDGSTHQVPIEIGSTQRKELAIRWLLAASRKLPGRNMAFKLSSELVDAAKGSGDALRKREETHRMAGANRTFAYFR